MYKASGEVALAQCSLHNKIEYNPNEKDLHDAKTVHATMLHTQVPLAAVAQNQPQKTKKNDSAASYMECSNSAGNLQLEAIMIEEALRECFENGKSSALSIEQYQQLLQICGKMSHQMASLQSDMDRLLQFENAANTSTTTNISSCDKCYHCKSTPTDAITMASFQKIKNEAELEAFEQSLQDEQFAMKAEKSFKRNVGQQRKKKKNCRKVCFELSSAIFEKTFWTQTTWLGTTDGDVVKFALSKHIVFLDFFKTIVGNFIKSIPDDAYFAAYFEGFAQNCCQQFAVKEKRKLRGEKVRAIQNRIKQEESQEEEEADLVAD